MARRTRKIKRSRSRKVRRVSQKRKSRKGGRKRRTKKRVSRKMKGGAEGIGKEYYFNDRAAWQPEKGDYSILKGTIKEITRTGVAIMGDEKRVWSHVYKTEDDAKGNNNGIKIKNILQQMHNEKEELKQAQKRLALVKASSSPISPVSLADNDVLMKIAENIPAAEIERKAKAAAAAATAATAAAAAAAAEAAAEAAARDERDERDRKEKQTRKAYYLTLDPNSREASDFVRWNGDW